jgi:ABC-type branched-subunit amino acid transport system ATPase component/branched-subunit amino acid ABC-type transport system permease component
VQELLSVSLSGAVTGAIYSLVAAGLTLSYSATGIFNFAYGAVAFSAAFIYYELHTGLEWAIGPAAVVTILVFAPLLGLVLDVAVFRPLAGATESAKVMATVGLLVALPPLTKLVTDELVDLLRLEIPRSSDVVQVAFPPGVGRVPKKDWTLPGDVPLDSNQLIVFVAAAVSAVVLWYLMRRTPLGLRMRAVVDRADLARTRGVDERVTSRWAWVIGMVLAALAGVVGAPVLGTLDPAVYVAIMFVAAAAAAAGGLRSVPLAFAGGLFLGVAQNWVVTYVDLAKEIQGFNTSVPFVLLLIGLLVIARDRGRCGDAAADETPPPDDLADLPAWRRALPWVLAVLLLIGYVWFVADAFWLGVMANGLALSLIFLSFVIVTGLGGMVSLAQATFVTAAGLTAGLLLNRYDWPFLPALTVGLLAAVVLGVLVALPALRLGGLPLALATLALAFVGENVLFEWDWVRNGQDGWTIPRPTVGPFDLADDRWLAMALLLLVGLVGLMIRNLQRSAWGRAIAAIRSSDVAASTSGASPLRTKLGVFALSAAVAGLGGVMYASYQQSVTSLTTPVTDGLLWLAAVVLFGIRRPMAAALAGIVAAVIPEILRSGVHWWVLQWDGTSSPDITAILFGLGAVQLARNPDGLLAITAAHSHARRLKRAARRAATGEVARTAAPTVAEAVALASARADENAAIVADTEQLGRELVGRGAVRTTSREAPVDRQRPCALVLEDVHAGYGDVEVLHGIDLVVRPGEITALLGPNGSGKSTTCSTIAGLVPVASGSVRLGDIDMTALRPHQRARRGALVAPESRGVFPGLSVEENLRLLLRRDGDRRAAYERFPALGERRRLAAGNLSGGEQQMLTLAPLLVRPPDVLVADEPTLGLAPLVAADVMQVFCELRDRGVALLLIEEKMRDVLAIADRVALLELGRIVWQGPRSGVDDERLARAYLGRVASSR